MAYKIDWEKRGVCSRFFGTITGEEIQAHAKQVTDDSRAQHVEYAISDLTAIDEHTILKSDVLFAAATDSRLKHTPLAVVYSPGRPSDLELIEIHRKSPLMQQREMKAFDSESEARAWIATIVGES